jgi:Asp/Glu/hydantoin racemase
MAKQLALIHTVTSLVPTFQALCREFVPDVHVFNLVDESLLQCCIREGRISPLTARRLAQHIISVQEAGADVAMVTCSSIGPAVEMSRPFVSIPVLRVDEPMANEAMRLGRRIGVAATLRSTLEPTVGLLRARADAMGKQIDVISTVCEGAFDAVVAGDAETHDTIVAGALRDLRSRVDVVVLAQASMARVVDRVPPGERPVPILSSPRLAVQHLAVALGQA